MINERILEFLDGSLSHEEEAELLHRLSVSPEKRGLLRSYMHQKALFARDKESIAVPYQAEQALWQRMATVLPPLPMAMAPAAMEATAPTLRTAGLLGRAFSWSSVAMVSATLFVGLGLGYLLGSGTSHTTVQNIVRAQGAQSLPPMTAAFLAPTPEIRYITKYVRVPVAAVPTNTATINDLTNSEVAPISSVQGQSSSTPALLAVGGEDGIKPYLHSTRDLTEHRRTLLERFEFGVTENFGREFPNSTATNSSMPIITNSAFSTFFQLSPNSQKFWAGAAFGTANVTKKSLYTRAGNPFDRLQDVLVADTVHSQSTYLAAFLQYRVPAFVGDMTFTAGYGVATLGQMLIGELGMHYDISREVGLQFGLRGMQFYYSLAADRQAAVNSGSGSLVIPKGIDQASPSFNLEVGTGLYFHF